MYFDLRKFKEELVIISGDIKIEFVNSNDQFVDIFIKPLRRPRIDYICNKLGTYGLYAPARYYKI